MGGEPAPVHVVNGDSAGRTLERSALPGAVIVWRSVLHEGRVPPGPPSLVYRERAAFLARAGHGSTAAIHADLAAADAALIVPGARPCCGSSTTCTISSRWCRSWLASPAIRGATTRA